MPYSWEYGPGEGWLNVFPRNQYWMATYPIAQRESPALPTVAPESVATAEVCFRLPDGWSVCTPVGIWADAYRDRGFPEISSSSPEFIPPPATQTTGTQGPVVVPSDASAELPSESETVAIDWGAIFQGGLDIANTYGQMTSGQLRNSFAGPAAVGPPPSAAPLMVGSGGTCGKSPCVCGVDSCGRPALIDPRTGKRCYKRRRRRLLTDRDFDDLMRISTLPNSKNVTTVLAKAIGRR